MGQVRRNCWNLAAGLALMALILQALAPLAKSIDGQYRKSLMAALEQQGLTGSICGTPGVSDNRSVAASETGAGLLSVQERASLAKKLRCPCNFGSHCCKYCVTYGFNLAVLCLLVLGIGWVFRRRIKDVMFPPLRDVAVHFDFLLLLSPRAPPFSLV